MQDYIAKPHLNSLGDLNNPANQHLFGGLLYNSRAPFNGRVSTEGDSLVGQAMHSLGPPAAWNLFDSLRMMDPTHRGYHGTFDEVAKRLQRTVGDRFPLTAGHPFGISPDRSKALSFVDDTLKDIGDNKRLTGTLNSLQENVTNATRQSAVDIQAAKDNYAQIGKDTTHARVGTLLGGLGLGGLYQHFKGNTEVQ